MCCSLQSLQCNTPPQTSPELQFTTAPFSVCECVCRGVCEYTVIIHRMCCETCKIGHFCYYYYSCAISDIFRMYFFLILNSFLRKVHISEQICFLCALSILPAAGKLFTCLWLFICFSPHPTTGVTIPIQAWFFRLR